MTLKRTFAKIIYNVDRELYCIDIVKYSSSTDMSLQRMHIHFKHSVRHTPGENYSFVLVFDRPEDQEEGDAFSDYILERPIDSIPALVMRMHKAYVVGDGYRKVFCRYNKLLGVGG